MSSRVAIDSFGYPDVFTAARSSTRRCPSSTIDPPPSTSVVMGGPRRPAAGCPLRPSALFLPVVVTGFSLHVAGGSSPSVSPSPGGRGRHPPPCLVAAGAQGSAQRFAGRLHLGHGVCRCSAWAVPCSPSGCWEGTRPAPCWPWPSPRTSPPAGCSLFQRAEWLLAVCMPPAVVGSLLALGLCRSRLPSGSLVVRGADRGLVVVVANRHLFARRWRSAALVRSDRAGAVKFSGTDLAADSSISVFIGFAAQFNGAGAHWSSPSGRCCRPWV